MSRIKTRTMHVTVFVPDLKLRSFTAWTFPPRFRLASAKLTLSRLRNSDSGTIIFKANTVKTTVLSVDFEHRCLD
jgi:hypothetical protein